MWATPEITSSLKQFARDLGCNWIGEIEVDPDLNYQPHNCHNNVLQHVEEYGGERILGYYFLVSDTSYQAIRHSVWNNYDRLIDITPYDDGRTYIVFGRSQSQEADYSIPNFYKYHKERCTDEIN